ERLVARLCSDGDGAHETDAGVRHEPRELDDSRLSLRGDVPDDVAAARRRGAAARAPVEGADAMSAPVLEVRGVHVRRGARRILSDVSFAVSKGGLVALMGPSGSGKTTMLRAIAALEPFNEGAIAVDGLVLEGGRAI